MERTDVRCVVPIPTLKKIDALIVHAEDCNKAIWGDDTERCSCAGDDTIRRIKQFIKQREKKKLTALLATIEQEIYATRASARFETPDIMRNIKKHTKKIIRL